MVKRQLIATGAIALALALTACSQPAPSPATSESAATTGASMAVSANEAETLMGVWNMTSLEAGADGSLANVPYSGQIAFDSESVSVQAMNPDTAAPHTAYTVQGYEAFYGDLTVDPEAGTWSVYVTSALARDLIGQTLRHPDGTLVLTPVDASEGWRVTYERVSD